MRIPQLMVALGLLLFAGCGGYEPPGTGGINGSAFIDAGCVDTYNNGIYLNCSKPGLEEKFSCDRISFADLNASALTPYAQLAECWRFWRSDGQPEGIRSGGCMARESMAYIAAVWTAPDCGHDGAVLASCAGEEGAWEFRQLGAWKEFSGEFAPVGSGAEALAFALAYSGDSVYSGEIPLAARRFVLSAAPTSVKETADGYEVNLIGYRFCGCGPHPYYENRYSVSRAGEVRQVGSQRIYEDPMQDLLCVD